MLQASPHGWHGAPSGGSSGIFVKNTIKVEVPFDKYPNFNFVGCLLGPRGNSLKRVEAATECRVLIRGRGSIKVPSRVISISPVLFSVSSPIYCSVSVAFKKLSV